MTEITLETLHGGAVPELFQRELESVLENIQDLNTEAEKARSIVVKVTIKPDEDRDSAVTKVQVKSALAPPKADTGLIYMGRDGDGALKAVGYDPRQEDLFGKEERDPDIAPIDRRAQGGEG